MTRIGGVVLGGGLLDRRRSWRDVSFASLDLETTGLDPARDAIVSFGVVPVEEGRARLDTAVYRVVRPGVEVSARSVTVHGIRPADLQDAPPLPDVAGELRGALHRRVVLAWAAWVEAVFLAGALGGRPAGWKRRIIDVQRLASWLDALEGRGRARALEEGLVGTAVRFGVPADQAHHALWDAFMTAELFLTVASRLQAMGRGDLASLLRAGRAQLRR